MRPIDWRRSWRSRSSSTPNANRRRPCPCLADGRTVIGLLDPAQGLGPREITAIADAYGCDSTIYKKESPDQTLDGIATQFLTAVTGAVGAGTPTSVVVLGHGLPTEIQSYHIRFERLAKALLDGAAGGAAPGRSGQGRGLRPRPASGTRPATRPLAGRGGLRRLLQRRLPHQPARRALPRGGPPRPRAHFAAGLHRRHQPGLRGPRRRRGEVRAALLAGRDRALFHPQAAARGRDARRLLREGRQHDVWLRPGADRGGRPGGAATGSSIPRWSRIRSCSCRSTRPTWRSSARSSGSQPTPRCPAGSTWGEAVAGRMSPPHAGHFGGPD